MEWHIIKSMDQRDSEKVVFHLGKYYHFKGLSDPIEISKSEAIDLIAPVKAAA